MNILIAVLLITLGFILGWVFTILRLHKPPIGTLRVDESDPYDGPYLFLELDSRPESFKRLKRVTLNVKAENYISQK